MESSQDLMLYVTGSALMISALMTMLPKPQSETGVYAFVYKILNLIAMNFGNAKNK